MRIFLTGATGWIGAAVAKELRDAGHSATGLTRNAERQSDLAAAGVTPVLGTLANHDVLRRAASEADGTIHTAFGFDFSDYERLSQEDTAAIETVAECYSGSDRPIVVTSGLGDLCAGTTFTEDARPPIMLAYPRASEQTAFALAAQGISASVVRPARSVHGVGERHGFVPQLASIAREKGVSAFIGEGDQSWPAVHRLDAARVYRLAVERGAANEAYHAVAEAVPFRLMAEAIGRQLGVPVKSIAAADAEAHFASLAPWVIGADEVSRETTVRLLGWEPREIGLIEDIDRADYFA